MKKDLNKLSGVKYKIFFAVFFLGVMAGFFMICPKDARAAIVIDPQYPHSFKYSNGTRYFPMGDTAYFLLGQSQTTIQQYIDSRSAHKFNFIRIGAVGKGFWPFGGSYTSPDYMTINETAMQKLDWVFTYAASKGINIELILWTYGDADDGGVGMWGNTTYENFWIDALVNRYKNRSNLFMYTVTNEFERYPNDVYSYASSDVDWARRVATRISNIDSVHAIGVHPSHWTQAIPPYSTFKTYNGISQHLPQVVWPLWQNSDVTVFNTQNNSGVQKNRWASACTTGATTGCAVYEATDWQGTNYPVTWTSTGWDFEGAGMEDSIAEDWSHGKPILNTEFGYQFESGITSSDRGFYTHQLHQQRTVRKKAWKIATAGGYFAAGFAHAAVDFNAAKVTVWTPGQLETLYNFFTQKTEYWKMAPHLELVSNLNSLLALPGTEYVAYFPRGGTNYVNLQSGNYSVEWLNPETGAYSVSANVSAPGGNYNFTPPSNTSADWVLHLQKSGTVTPTCTSFTYSPWSTCQSNNTQTRTATASSPSGCTGGNPVISQACTNPVSCGDQVCNGTETCSTCPGDCGACAKKYTLTDFISLVTDWRKTLSGSPADVNLDNKVNSKDLGIMMSNWFN